MSVFDLPSTYRENESTMVEKVNIEAIGKGWVASYEISHCTLGIKQEREVFIDAHEMILWVMEHLNSYEPGETHASHKDGQK